MCYTAPCLHAVAHSRDAIVTAACQLDCSAWAGRCEPLFGDSHAPAWDTAMFCTDHKAL